MLDAPIVASVLLVATHARRIELRRWLRAVRVPVAYDLAAIEPDEVAWLGSSNSFDLVVIDGASIEADDARELLLRHVRVHPEQFAALLYICRYRAREPELAQAFLWADDLIGPDEAGPTLQRRVQAIALAPWRRSLALRTRVAV